MRSSPKDNSLPKIQNINFDTERCQGCYTYFRKEEVREFQDYYYCSPCYKQITNKPF